MIVIEIEMGVFKEYVGDLTLRFVNGEGKGEEVAKDHS
jgi:hypothetical protein